jgi:hypothetical protein
VGSVERGLSWSQSEIQSGKCCSDCDADSLTAVQLCGACLRVLNGSEDADAGAAQALLKAKHEPQAPAVKRERGWSPGWAVLERACEASRMGGICRCTAGCLDLGDMS